MAITQCTVSGTVKSLINQAIPTTVIRAYIPKPFFYSDGTHIVNYEVQTTCDTDGAWSLALIETTTAQVSMTIAFEYPSGSAGTVNRKEYTVVIPNQASANFSTLVGTQD